MTNSLVPLLPLSPVQQVQKLPFCIVFTARDEKFPCSSPPPLPSTTSTEASLLHSFHCQEWKVPWFRSSPSPKYSKYRSFPFCLVFTARDEKFPCSSPPPLPSTTSTEASLLHSFHCQDWKVPWFRSTPSPKYSKYRSFPFCLVFTARDEKFPCSSPPPLPSTASTEASFLLSFHCLRWKVPLPSLPPLLPSTASTEASLFA